MVTNYTIFDDMLDLRNMVDRFFRESQFSARMAEYPLVNLFETDDELIIEAVTPGIAVNEINLSLLNGSLVIGGEKKNDHRELPYIRNERTFGRFNKTVKLPFPVDPGKIEASMKDGILTVKLVKSEAAKPRRIEIK